MRGDRDELARGFVQVLGYTQDKAAAIDKAVLDGLPRHAATPKAQDQHGQRYQVDIPSDRSGRQWYCTHCLDCRA